MSYLDWIYQLSNTQIIEILLTGIIILVAITRIVGKPNMSGLQDELKKYIDEKILEAIGKPSTSKIEVQVPAPPQPQTNTVNTIKLKELLQLMMKISQSIDTDSDGRKEIYDKLTTLEERITDALKLLEGGE